MLNQSHLRLLEDLEILEFLVDKQAFASKIDENQIQHYEIDQDFDGFPKDFNHVSTSFVNNGAPSSRFKWTRSWK